MKLTKDSQNIKDFIKPTSYSALDICQKLKTPEKFVFQNFMVPKFQKFPVQPNEQHDIARLNRICLTCKSKKVTFVPLGLVSKSNRLVLGRMSITAQNLVQIRQ